MRITLPEIEATLNTLVDWPTRVETGERKQDTRLLVDASNCSAIAHLYSLSTRGNTLVSVSRHDNVTVFSPLDKTAVDKFIAYVKKVEGYGYDA